MTTDNFTLRPFTTADAKALSENLNTKTIERDTTMKLPWSVDDASWWISFITDAAKRNPIPELHFAVEIDGELAGSIGIINIEGHKGELGYWLKDKYAGKGVMTKVIEQATQICTKDLGLKRIFAPVLTHNKASARVLEKNNFQLEGTARKMFEKKGKYLDAFCYGWVK